MVTVPAAAKSSKPSRPRPSTVTKGEADRAVKGTGVEWFVRVWQGQRLSCYWLLPLVSDFGVAYEFQASRTTPAGEMQADSYAVLLELDGHSCECPGHLRWGVCKHVEALKILIEQGVLGK
jgi:hypothetical protein